MDGSPGAGSDTSLPRPLTSLVGRDRDTQRIRALIQPEQARLVTLTGPGGVGKTRLALQVAASMHQDFTHGAYFVSLAPVSDPDLVLATVAQTLGVPEVTGEPTLRSLCSALSDKHLLLILDNFEQLLGSDNPGSDNPGSAGPQVLELVQCAPRLHVLVTSRTVLRVYGEQEYGVLPLSFPVPEADTNESPEALARYEAVRLFVERARAVKPDFALTESNGPAVARICRRLDGLPLAIELAAARLKLMSPQALIKRLDRALPLLTHGATTHPSRHKTLRDAIAWSYDLLGDDEKGLFCCLSVFVGGCTLEAAEAVCGAHSAGPHDNPDNPDNPDNHLLDTLAALVDKSLLRQVEQEEGEPRFSMLETIREFALDACASSGDEEAVRARHALYFLELAERAEPELLGAGQAAWLDLLAQEHDNLRAALAWAERSGDAEGGLRLAGALRTFWRMRGYLSEGRKWLSQALERGAGAPAEMQAKALNGLGNLAFMQGDLSSARDYYEQDLALGRALGDKGGVARALNNLGNIARVQGDFERCKSLQEESLALYAELGQGWGMANALHNLSVVSWDLEDPENARRLGYEALRLRRELGDKAGLASVLNSLGEYAQSEGDNTVAGALLEECLSLSREVGDKIGIARALYVLGEVSAGQGDHERARELQSESLRLRHELGSKRGIIQCLEGLAASATQIEPRRVVVLLAAAEELRSTIGASVAADDRMRNEQALELARTKLGPEAFAAAHLAGRRLSVEDAVALALEAPAQPQPVSSEVAGTAGTSAASAAPERGVSTNGHNLTARELEVLRLVTVGLSNPEIALHLSLSVYTVQTHLRSIFSKIDVSTRSAAVRYAFEHHLG